MEIKYLPRITSPGDAAGIMDLLTLCDAEFVPPLSSRVSTTQHALGPAEGDAIPDEYYDNIARQHTLVAYESGKIVGFLSYKLDYVCQEIPPQYLPNVYITTIIVHPDWRRHGITNALYAQLMRKYRRRQLFTRTWSTNISHTRILASLGFHEHLRIENDRGEGIDTVYYHFSPATRSRWQILRQYHLTGNLLFFCILMAATLAFLAACFNTNTSDIVHELFIAFATSLIASLLCLLSDTLLKYRESKNDEYINKLKSFGIENLQFHKNELLESILPRCTNEIWITGYRLIMTAKASFRRAITTACRRRPGLRMKLLVVPPWIRSYQLIYGTEDVSDNYVRLLRDLGECVDRYGLQLEVRLSEKPVFNDTYKVDDRFITGPYLNCLDQKYHRITAKDFFSLDINDPSKELYGLIYNDYMAVWDECPWTLDLGRFAQGLASADLNTPQGRLALLRESCVARDPAPEPAAGQL